MTNKLRWIGLIATLVLVVILPIYALRETDQQEHLLNQYSMAAIITAIDLYAENCAVCHGAAGEGIADNPPLNTDAVRLMPETDLMRVISRGRDNTLMAAWAEEEGGIFSNAQIQDFVTLLQQAEWNMVEARVSEMGLTPPEVISMEVSETMLASLNLLSDGESLSNGLEIYAQSCAACHGANGTGTAIAPAIGSPEVRAKPYETITQVINNGVAGTLMAGWKDKLSTEEIDDVVNLIFRWQEIIQAGVEFAPVETATIVSSPEMIATGDRLFNIACKSCHGTDGYGTRMAPALNNLTFLAETPDAAIYQIIAAGIQDTLMPAWGTRLTDQDMQALVAFLRSLEPTAPPFASPVNNP